MSRKILNIFKKRGFDTNNGSKQRPKIFASDNTVKENRLKVEGKEIMEEKKSANPSEINESEKKYLRYSEISKSSGGIVKQTSDEDMRLASSAIDCENRRDEKLWIKLECDFSVKGDRNIIERNNSAIREFLNRVRDNCSVEPGNVGVRLNTTIDIMPSAPEKVKIFKSSPFFEELGIKSVEYREGYVFLDGIPKKDYEGGVEIRMTITYRDFIKLPDDSESIATINARKDVSLQFMINKRPEDMWEDKDPPSDEPYQKEKSVCDSFRLNGTGKIVLVASQRGRSHAHNGTFRDDDYAFNYDQESGWCYLAVADGAGSARFSREGSRIACKGIVSIVRDNFNRSGLSEVGQEQSLISGLINGTVNENQVRDELFHNKIFNAVRNIQLHIEKEAVKNNADTRDYHTTLLFAAVKKFKDVWLVVTYWVGDGGLVILNPDNTGSVMMMGQPDSGEFAGQTKFLTMKQEMHEEPIKKRIHVAAVKDFDGIFLMTDGVTDPFFPAEENIGDPEYWGRFMKEVIPKEFPGVFDKGLSIEKRAEALLKGLNFYSKGNHDDRTMLIVTDER